MEAFLLALLFSACYDVTKKQGPIYDLANYIYTKLLSESSQSAKAIKDRMFDRLWEASGMDDWRISLQRATSVEDIRLLGKQLMVKVAESRDGELSAGLECILNDMKTLVKNDKEVQILARNVEGFLELGHKIYIEMAKAKQIEELKNIAIETLQDVKTILSGHISDAWEFREIYDRISDSSVPVNPQFSYSVEESRKYSHIRISRRAQILLVRTTPLLSAKYDHLYGLYLFSWGDEIKEEISKTGHHLIELAGDTAVRSVFEKTVNERPSIEAIIFYGYGEPDALLGSDGNAIGDISNVSLLSKRILYCVCCKSVEFLMNSAEHNGIEALFGYKDALYLAPHIEIPMKKCVNGGIVEMLRRGCGAYEAAKIMIDIYSKWIDRFEKEQDKIDKDWFISAAILILQRWFQGALSFRKV